MNITNTKIVIVGLGYVGLPLAIEFAKKYPVIGYDNNIERINQLKKAVDITLEIETPKLQEIVSKSFNGEKSLYLTSTPEEIIDANVYIVTVPTPITTSKQPDLRPLINASQLIGKVLKSGDLVIYESTTYPGCTEEDCVPVLEKMSGLKFNVDFYCGYSPERISPGDKVNNLITIKKLTSGSTPEAADYVNSLYASIITAGTHKTSSIKIAEASKAIENAQRDVGISFANELALIFDRLDIDTNEVLDAAATKWNFINYRPGLVGGHCISVDPYYLAHKAQQKGYHPAVILSGRRVNDSMGIFIANKLVKIMIVKGIRIKNAKVLIMGITFKENCPDLRNTRIIDIRQELIEFGCDVDVLDPLASPEEVRKHFNFNIITDIPIDLEAYSGVILGVAHDEFKELHIKKSDKLAVYDVKGVLDRDNIDARL